MNVAIAKQRRWWLWSALAIAGLLAVASIAILRNRNSVSAAKRTTDSLLVVGFGTEPTTLDWQKHGDPAAELALWSINEALIELGPRGEFIPRLAASVPAVDPDDPGRWRVELRRGVSFTNGEPFNAAAVKANVDRITAPDFETITSGYERLAGAQVVSEYVVDLLTDGPDPVFLFRLPELRFLPPKAMNDPGYAENPVGTGPYVFERWDRGNVIVLKKNPGYWDKPGSIATVEIRFITDEGTRLSALQTGEIDLAPIAPDQADRVPQVVRSATAVESGALRFNLTKAPYSDIRFRQALNYAIDKEAINNAIFGGFFEVSACQALPAGAFGFNPDLAAYEYDPEKARDLLAQVAIPAGVVIEFDGVAEFWIRDREVQEAIASYWRDIGLDVDLTINTTDSYLDKLLAGDDSPGIMYMELDHRYFHGARILDRQFNREGTIATIGTALPEVDALMSQTQNFDEAVSLDAYHELFHIGCEEAVSVFTLDRFDVWGAAEDVRYVPGRGGLHRLDFNRVSFDE
jgi:peptide/nickel transport system substrate-binding protein